MTAASYKKTLLTALGTVLLPAGFRRRGANFKRTLPDVIQVVQLQSSQRSTAHMAVVTVNMGVFSTTLEAARGGAVTKPTEPDCHWRNRLRPPPLTTRDDWWQVSDPVTAVRVGEELAAAMATEGLPVLDRLSSTAALVAVWRSGASPGLTAFQRLHYLATLDAVPDSHRTPVA